jgi:predicted AAA+ superfamily ATPase
LTQDNQERELRGLISALSYFDLSEGIIITADTTDEILQDGKKIHVIPAWLTIGDIMRRIESQQ